MRTERDHTGRWGAAIAGGLAAVVLAAAPGAPARPMAYDGPLVAFESYRDGNAEIYVARVDGGSPEVNLTQTPGANDRHPSWSREVDGNTCPQQGPPEPATAQQLAFDSDRDGGDADIFVTNGLAAPPAAVADLTSDDPADDTSPAWSSSGLIAYTSDHGGDREIWVMDADGNNKTQITDNSADDANPDWSPLSDQLAFESDRGGTRQIYVVDLDQSGAPVAPVHQVTSGGQPKHDPTWASYSDSNGVSLQGPHDIAYSVGQGGTRYLDVAEVGSNAGPGVANPFHDAAAIRTFPLTGDPGGDTAPNWSPIGFNIVFASTAGAGNEDIYGLGSTFALGSPAPWQGPATRLTADPARDTNPDWEPAQQCSVMGPRPPIPAPTRAHPGGGQGGGTPGGGHPGGGHPGGDPGGGGHRPRCTIRGGPSNDVLRGTSRRDVICGGGGDDRILGGRGNDVIDGGSGNDRISGGSGNDRLIGGRGRDRISGGQGNDLIAAKDRQRDTVSGGRGYDIARLDKRRDRGHGVERRLW